jgi:predicted nucleic acid-binding protein
MYSNRFTAVVDACTLADVAKRDLLLTLAEAGLYRLRWSDMILSETEGAIGKILSKRKDAKQRAKRAVKAMRAGFPESEYCDYKEIEQNLSCLPDPKDHHVLAVAIACRASVIVTENLKDFPEASLKPYMIEAKPADIFIADSIDLDYPQSVKAISGMLKKLSNPALTPQDWIEKLQERGMTETVEVVFPHIHSL